MKIKKAKKDSSLSTSSSTFKSKLSQNRDNITISDKEVLKKKIKGKFTIQSSLSTSLLSPSKIGVSEKSKNWECSLLEKLSEENANELIKDNDCLETLSSDKFYLIVRVKCKRLSGQEEFSDINIHNFGLVGAKKILYRPHFMGLDALDLNSTLLIGGSIEGWISFKIPKGDNNFILIFEDPSILDRHDRIYFSLN